MMCTTWFLAQAADKSSRLLADILPWLIVLIGVVLVGGVAIYFIRRYLHADHGASDAGFSLQDLRDLHVAGELTDEEFQRAKSMMIGRMAAATTPSKKNDDPEPPAGNRAQSSN